MNKTLMSSVAAIALIGASGYSYATPGMGDIVLTGHDNDFHLPITGNAKAALTAEIAFVRAGATDPTLPVLVFDQGTELVNALKTVGVDAAHQVVVSTIAGIAGVTFDPTKFSAMAVASITSCGGCDNTPAFIAALALRKADIATFFNAGDGILGLAAALDPAGYAYVPATATNPGGSPPSTGYITTAIGKTLGLPAVDGDTTHNFFNNPGTGGLSAAYVVTEINTLVKGLNNETIACFHCTTSTIVGTPEPGTLGILGAGLVGLAAAWRRKRRLTA
jgi:PEP-CTERM motif